MIQKVCFLDTTYIIIIKKDDYMNLFERAQIIRIFFFAFVAFVVLALICLVIVFVKQKHKKNKDIDYFKTQLHKIIRNEALEKAINNYSKGKNREYWLVKAIEINQFGEKEHFFNLQNHISIGRDFNSNNLFVLDEEADLIQCKIELHKELPFLVGVSTEVDSCFSFKKKMNRSIDKKQTIKSGETVRLYSGDSLEFGNTKIVFQVFNSSVGIV